MPGRHSCRMDAASCTTARRACRRTPASISDRSTRRPESQSTTRLLAADSDPVYMPSSNSSDSGFLLFLREGTLLVQPFDGRSQLIGDADPDRRGRGKSRELWVVFCLSHSGALAFRTGRAGCGEPQSSYGSIGKGNASASSGRELEWRHCPAVA